MTNPIIQIRGPVDLETSTVDHWRKLTNELRLAAIAAFYLNENGVNEDQSIRFVKFNETLDIPVELDEGGYITTKQDVLFAGSLQADEDSEITFLRGKDEGYGFARKQYEATVSTLYSYDISINSFGTITLLFNTSDERFTVRKYLFSTNDETLSIELESELVQGDPNIDSVVVEDNALKFSMLTDGKIFLYVESVNASIIDETQEVINDPTEPIV